MKKAPASYWLRLEDRIREALNNYEKEMLIRFEKGGNVKQLIEYDPSIACLFSIAEIIGEETGRGYPLEKLNKT